MLSLNQTYEDRRLMRVLVAPVGNNSLFSEQYQVVSALREIPYYELSPPQYAKNYTPPFKFVNWIDGSLLFQYLRYDRASSGPGDLDDFQSSKRLLMVMGLINYPDLLQDSKSLEEEIENFNRRYPHIYLKRFFVFNYNFDAPTGPSPSLSSKMQVDPDALVIFPPDGECEGGGSMIEFHFKIVMSNAAVKLILYLEKQMDICEEARAKNVLPTEISLSTVHDDRDDILLSKDGSTSSSAASTKNKKAFKKKPAGRIRKWMGDLCMQVGSPVDAVEHYVSAVAECRSLGDYLWLAGALDGYASAILMLKQMNINLEEIIGKDLKTVTLPVRQETEDVLPDVEKVYLLAEERANEAISVYSSSVILRQLEVECCLRLAMMFERAEIFYEREQRVVEYVMRAAAVPGLNTQQQIECTLEGALICYRLQLYRKYALFLYIAALMTAESGNYDMADSLLLQTCEQIGAKEVLYDFQDLMKEEVNHENIVAWNSIKSSIYTNGIMLAKEAQNSMIATRFLSGLLKIMSHTELKHGLQRERFSKYDRKKLGLEKFVKKRKPSILLSNNNTTNNSSNPPNSTSSKDTTATSAAPTSSALTEDALKKLGAQSTKAESVRARSVIQGGNQLSEPGMYRSKSVTSELPSNFQTSSTSQRPTGIAASTTSGSSRPMPSLANDILIESGKRRTSFNPLASIDESKPLPLTQSSKEPDDFIGTHISELTQAAESVIKSGLRNLSVPKFPTKLAAFVSKQPSDPALKKLQQMDNNRNQSEKLLRSFLYENSSLEIEPTMPEESNSIFHWVDLDQAKDILSSVAMHLTAQSVALDQQESALEMLYLLAESLEKKVDVQLPVFVTSVQPMECTDPFRPIPTKMKSYEQYINEAKKISSETNDGSHETSSSNEAKSAFYYDPFAAKRGKQQQQQRIEVYWPTNVLATIIAVFMNPLSHPIKLTRVTPLISGVEHIVYPLELDIPSKTEYYEVELPIRILSKGEMKIEGIMIEIGHLTQKLDVDQQGFTRLASSYTTATTIVAAANSSSNDEVSNITSNLMSRYKTHRHRPASTNEVRIVDCAYEVDCNVSWVADDTLLPKQREVEGRNIATSRQPVISTSVDLYPGEIRSERMWIRVPPASIPMSPENMSYVVDVKVTCTEHMINSGSIPSSTSTSVAAPPVVTYTLKDFQHLTSLDNIVDSSNNNNSNSNNSKSKASAALAMIRNVKHHDVLPQELIEISFDMHYKEQVKAITWEVEVVCLHPMFIKMIEAIRDWKEHVNAADEGLMDKKKEHIRQLYTSWLALDVDKDIVYTRKLVVEIDIEMKSGVVLEDLKLCQTASVNEIKQLSNTLAHALKSSYEVNYVLSTSIENVRYRQQQAHDDMPSVRYLTDKPLVLLQIANMSGHESCVGSSLSHLHILQPSNIPAHGLIQSFDAFYQASGGALLTSIPKTTTINTFVSYSFSTTDREEEEGCDADRCALYWILFDRSRWKKTYINGTFIPCQLASQLFRVGRLCSFTSTLPPSQQQVNIAPRSPLLHPLLASIPKIKPQISFYLEEKMVPWEDEHQTYLRIPTLSFVDVNISIEATACEILANTKEIEMITVIVEETKHHYYTGTGECARLIRREGRETSSNSSGDSDDESSIEHAVDDEMSIISSSMAFAEGHNMGYIVSGKLHTRHSFPAADYTACCQSSKHGCLMQHPLQICFLRAGKYSIRTLVKLHSNGDSAGVKTDQDWWTTKQDVVVMVYSA